MPPPTKGAVGEVVGDNLYIACGNVCRLVKPNTNDLYKLDLNTWIWHKLEPRGTKPLESCFMASWVRGEKIFIFGGAVSGEEVGAGYPDALDIVDCYSNQLVYYDTQINSYLVDMEEYSNLMDIMGSITMTSFTWTWTP